MYIFLATEPDLTDLDEMERQVLRSAIDFPGWTQLVRDLSFEMMQSEVSHTLIRIEGRSLAVWLQHGARVHQDLDFAILTNYPARKDAEHVFAESILDTISLLDIVDSLKAEQQAHDLENQRQTLNAAIPSVAFALNRHARPKVRADVSQGCTPLTHDTEEGDGETIEPITT